jgi:hypothetical protein
MQYDITGTIMRYNERTKTSRREITYNLLRRSIMMYGKPKVMLLENENLQVLLLLYNYTYTLVYS